MNPEPIWDWPSSVQFLGQYRVEGESSKFRNSVGYITAMNALQCNAMATDAIMAKHRRVEIAGHNYVTQRYVPHMRRPGSRERLAIDVEAWVLAPDAFLANHRCEMRMIA